MATISMRRFNQYPAAALDLAARESVFITSRGNTKYVLLSIETYEELSHPKRNLRKSLRMAIGDYPETDVEVEPGYTRWPD